VSQCLQIARIACYLQALHIKDPYRINYLDHARGRIRAELPEPVSAPRLDDLHERYARELRERACTATPAARGGFAARTAAQ